MAASNQCIFRKNWVVCSSAGPKILAFGTHSSANVHPILYCFIPNFKLKYEDSENIKVDRFQLRPNLMSDRCFLGHPLLTG